jgi:hypothetical protein
VDPIDSALSAADRAWRAYGVDPADRAALAADLRLDLQAAAGDGRTPGQLLGPDVGAFARRLADEAGVPRTLPEHRRVLETAFIGAVLGAVVAWALMAAAYPLFLRMVTPPDSVRVPIPVTLGIYYGVPAAVVVAGAVAAVRIRLRHLPRIRSTARAMSVLLPVAGLLITPVTMGFAWTTDYSVAEPVVLAEIAMVLAALAGATVLARIWALRDRRPVQPVQAGGGLAGAASGPPSA